MPPQTTGASYDNTGIDPYTAFHADVEDVAAPDRQR